MEGYELRFSELSQKEVVNIEDGRKLGNVVDMLISLPDGRIESIIVPGNVRLCDFFRFNREGYALPWQSVCKIGDDVILVRLDADFLSSLGE